MINGYDSYKLASPYDDLRVVKCDQCGSKYETDNFLECLCPHCVEENEKLELESE